MPHTRSSSLPRPRPRPRPITGVVSGTDSGTDSDAGLRPLGPFSFAAIRPDGCAAKQHGMASVLPGVCAE